MLTLTADQIHSIYTAEMTRRNQAIEMTAQDHPALDIDELGGYIAEYVESPNAGDLDHFFTTCDEIERSEEYQALETVVFGD